MSARLGAKLAIAPESEGLDARDRERAASLADEGGAAGASVERQGAGGMRAGRHGRHRRSAPSSPPRRIPRRDRGLATAGGGNHEDCIHADTKRAP
jgi:hypothetical protein